jgi:1-acyl-sn-glycerol-3-phosphate acyltransferase
MWIKFVNLFTKVTAWPVQKVVFRTKIMYQDKAVQNRKIKGPAIVVSNHTAVWDYAIWLFVFISRTLRFQMAELLFKKPVLGPFLRGLGGILVDRNAYDFSFLDSSMQILEKGGVVGVFPESRIPRPEEQRPLPFKPSAAWLAILSGAPVIPVYTNGVYFSMRRAKVVIGTPFYAADFTDESLSEKENISRVNEVLRARIIELEKVLNDQ